MKNLHLKITTNILKSIIFQKSTEKCILIVKALEIIKISLRLTDCHLNDNILF